MNDENIENKKDIKQDNNKKSKTVWLKICLLLFVFVIFVINIIILFNSREGL